MVTFEDFPVLDECKNLEQSYGEICVSCNKCGRFSEGITNNKDITNIQQARAIIKAVGEPYQYQVVQLLREQTYYSALVESERQAQKVIANMENEYVLNVANVLWKEKFQEIPEHIKKYS